MILTIGNTKGGTGKSTLAVNIAIHRARSHSSVLLVDGDEQQSALSFTQLRNQNDYAAVALTGKNLHQQVPKLNQKYPEVIIDVGGRDSHSFRAALTITNLLLIPVQPRTFELDKKEVSITTMRLKTKFIQRMDAAAEHEGMNRTAWMVRVVTKYLNDNGF